MDKSLKAAIEYHLKSKVLDSFEDFLDELLLLLHDEEYQPTRHYRDKGCDGILFDDTIVNMYAPEKYDKYNFEKKFKEDFKKYKDHWRNDYPNLLICYNGEFTSENIIFLDNLEPGFKIKKKGFKQIINEIDKLKWPML